MVIAGFRCEYELFTLILTQNKSKEWRVVICYYYHCYYCCCFCYYLLLLLCPYGVCSIGHIMDHVYNKDLLL